MKNKKAGERVLSIYLFIIYVIVSIGIVSGVILFYGSGIDVRNAEAGILTDKIIDCLTEQGGIKREAWDKGIDLKSLCRFDFRENTKKYQGEERYAVKVELYDFDTGELKKTFPIAGNADFLQYCNAEGDKIAKCNEKQIYILYGQAKFLMKINSAIGKVQYF